MQQRGAADLVMPSKLTNIAAAGRPCIATAAPETALGDVILAHGIGTIVPPEAADLLAHAIDELAANEKSRLEMGRLARDFAERELSKDRILEQFESRLTRIVRPDKSNP